jgi:hypothetical protein
VRTSNSYVLKVDILMKNDIYNWIIRALRNVEKCYFEARNERTFHSEFYHQLRLLQDQTDPKYKLMCEVEKVKRTLGKRKRPDIIFPLRNSIIL